MTNRQSLWIALASAALSTVLVALLYRAQITQIDMQERVSVLAPNRFVDAGELLAEEDLRYVTVAASDVSESMLRDKRQATGRVVAVPLGEAEPLLAWKLDSLGLVPRLGQSTFQIPKSYVLSVSSGIRAGDRVRLYVSIEEGRSKPLFSVPVTVASVKTSAYREVDGIDHSAIQARLDGDEEALLRSRRNGNGAIEHIDLILTEAQWLEIDDRCKDGVGKLVIAYAADESGKGGTE